MERYSTRSNNGLDTNKTLLIWHQHFSSDLSLELVATGEKAGLWGTITNTNLQLLQTATSGYVEVTLSSGNVNLDLSDGSATTEW